MISEAKNFEWAKRNQSEQQPKKRRKGNQTLDEAIENNVIEFFESEENSKTLPGKKDVKSVKQADGKRKLIQKKLVLCNLQELHRSFQEKHPNYKISLTKFAELRPKHCVLAGSSGTHTVCVCVLHQNVKLLLNGENFIINLINF